MTKPGAIPDPNDIPMVFEELPSNLSENEATQDPFEYQMKAIQLVLEKYNRDIVDISHEEFITEREIYVVWFAKTLQNWKALVSTTRPDGHYYELTYNGDIFETYIDVYKKLSNETISDYER